MQHIHWANVTIKCNHSTWQSIKEMIYSIAQPNTQMYMDLIIHITQSAEETESVRTITNLSPWAGESLGMNYWTSTRGELLLQVCWQTSQRAEEKLHLCPVFCVITAFIPTALDFLPVSTYTELQQRHQVHDRLALKHCNLPFDAVNRPCV